MTRSLGSLAHSLANLFHDRSQTQEYHVDHDHPHEDPDYVLLGQGRRRARPQGHPQTHPRTQEAHAAGADPTRQEVLNYLGQLAKDYRLPEKLVYAVADAESSVNPKIDPQPNYEMRHGKRVLDEHGNPIVKSWDYGLMQINSPRIGHDVVKDPHGHPFKIEEDGMTDWRANARAGVAALAPAYHLAELEQGPGATAEDHAQQAYSQYNGGSPKTRERYLKEKHGLPSHGADRNFLKKYEEWPDQKR
jgi:soluble lytic murein transglycosylase-like protein